VHDPWEKNVPGIGLGRDPERTPMQWDATENAGFTSGVPWLPLSTDCKRVNVATQRYAGDSMFSLYRRLIALRRREPALSIGAHIKAETIGQVLTYRRFNDGRWITMALNFGDKACCISRAAEMERVLLSTYLDREDQLTGDHVNIRPNEGLVIAAS
jgi:alpha-glucosidase